MIRWGVSPAWAEEENEQQTMSVKDKSVFFISFTLNTAQNKKSPRLRQEDCTLFHFILTLLHGKGLNSTRLSAVSSQLKAKMLHPGRSSGFRFVLLTGLPVHLRRTVAQSVFVPGYSGGTTPDFHGIPY
jgi:hypothetical protein